MVMVGGVLGSGGVTSAEPGDKGSRGRSVVSSPAGPQLLLWRFAGQSDSYVEVAAGRKHREQSIDYIIKRVLSVQTDG